MLPDSHPDPNSTDAIPFREWMRRALFDPGHGYYARQVRTVGRRGDFSTSATISPALGEAVAGWLRRELSAAREVRTIIEVGGGDGSLLCTVLRALGFAWRWRLRVFMVESSPVLTARQRNTLGTSKVRWFAEMNDALAACQGRAIIFHNELLDAFPVTLVEWDHVGREWQEVWVARENGRWIEQLRTCSIPVADRPAFSLLAEAPAKPQRGELGTAARAWLQGWAPAWHAGTMLTIDYGDEFPQLYDRRPRGTLRAYLAHQTLTGAAVLENMGRQDITADINFTDLANWGEALGWKSLPRQTQRAFLQTHLPRVEARARRDPSLRFLLDEQGAGGAFQTLVLRKG